jgi:hypothetical protein
MPNTSIERTAFGSRSFPTLGFSMSQVFYLYMLHESPIEKPYYCKVGYSDDPVRRLDQLQSGNPRHLRCWDVERRPTKPFGFRLPSEEHARRLETRVHDRLEGMGLRTRRDMNYETFKAPAREWFAEMHPEELWLLMAKMYWAYLQEHSISIETIHPGLEGNASGET